MDTVIGLGSAGCNLVDIFKEKYSSYYDTYKIDSEIEDGLSIGYFDSPESYEANTPDVKKFLDGAESDVLFIVGGGGQISATSLRILSQIREKNLNVLYICPEVDQISQIGLLQHRLAFNVFQEYALSGNFQKLLLFDNKKLSEIIGEVPIMEFNNKINNLIVDSVHYYNIFNNVKPVISTLGKVKNNSRICSFGIYDMVSGAESNFFDMQAIDEKRYHFFINETALKTDGKLFKTIKEIIAKQDIRSSYQVLTTQHQQNFCYVENYTNINQALDTSSSLS